MPRRGEERGSFSWSAPPFCLIFTNCLVFRRKELVICSNYTKGWQGCQQIREASRAVFKGFGRFRGAPCRGRRPRRPVLDAVGSRGVQRPPSVMLRVTSIGVNPAYEIKDFEPFPLSSFVLLFCIPTVSNASGGSKPRRWGKYREKRLLRSSRRFFR